MIGKCNPNASQARRVLYACALLRRAGCRILAASANGAPRIRVDRRPRIDWIQPGRKVTSAQFGVLAARLDDIQVEWTDRRYYL
ncbi:hypothetical protein [Endozoicomonas sp. 4G]|uniref:hypothetical protein n=1 Tax=Endozoicomonas sp. 4G TaxID=2872754 RepID=UPI0020785D21|nr:hypothetical protein [Endozoicomonas sp. 4G]